MHWRFSHSYCDAGAMLRRVYVHNDGVHTLEWLDESRGFLFANGVFVIKIEIPIFESIESISETSNGKVVTA